MRLTARTKTLVVAALESVGYDTTHVIEKLASAPTDESCHTCGLFSGGRCHMHGAAQIPRDFQEKGCSDWDDRPVPF